MIVGLKHQNNPIFTFNFVITKAELLPLHRDLSPAVVEPVVFPT